MKLILQYFRDAIRAFPRQFAVSMCIIVAMTVMNTCIPWGLRQYLDTVTECNDYGVLVIGVGLFAAYLMGKVFVNIAWFVSLDRFGGKYIETLTLSLERAMAATSYAEIEKKQAGVIQNILYTDVLNVFRVIGHAAPAMFGAFTVVLASLALSFFYDLKLTLFICLAAALGLLLSFCSRKALARTAGKTNVRLKEHNAWCTQFVNMLPLVQCNNILPYYLKRTEENIREFIVTSIEEDKRTLFWSGTVTGYHSLFTIALSALLAIPASGNSVANLVFFTMIANMVMEQAQSAELLLQQIIKAYVSFEHVDGLRKLPKSHGEEQAGPVETIEFEAVSFSYPAGGSPALDGVSLRLQKGDSILLQGRNGSGKSTFLKLLTGLYLPTEGEIRIDGRSAETYSRESLNERILYVNQDEGCLNETFREYLTILSGAPLSAERFAELLRFVDLPEEERRIAGNGASLSVGQRKKLFLMKLLLRYEKASVVILDELTAGLDAETAQKTSALLAELFSKGDKIFIVVDHAPPEALPFSKRLEFQEGKLL